MLINRLGVSGFGILINQEAYRALLLKRLTRFPSSPLIIRVPFFLLFGFNKGTQKEKG